jgi:hypothetical protein
MADKKPENPVEAQKLVVQAEERLAKLVGGPLPKGYRDALEARIKTAVRLYPMLTPIAEKHGVPVDELIALHVVETRGKGDPMGRTSSAQATGPFQLTSVARKDYPPSAEYRTQVETDADSAAQYLKAARKAGFTMPEAIGMTYIAGIEGVKKWGGGNDGGHVGENSKAYGPMFKYAIERLKTAHPEHVAQVEKDAANRGKIDARKAFEAYEVVKPEEGVLGTLFGPSAEEVEASRLKRLKHADFIAKDTAADSKWKAELMQPYSAGYK